MNTAYPAGQWLTKPEAAELFAKAEQTLTAAKRHLGDELYEKFSITLLDMKPEYVG
ncbi:hypothetical protein [Atlantibacter hermannii]|uniref:hypothetical protein n=1 Tax=Atlantibacter hermannii TaxID=565 RepID=UPI002899E407|nr:hypothetical protein [Atlantibacter hermannii]